MGKGTCTCVTCGSWFEWEGSGYAPSREHCYRCKSERLTARSVRRGCPTCGKRFNIDLSRPDLKQCPKCRQIRADKVQINRKSRS